MYSIVGTRRKYQTCGIFPESLHGKGVPPLPCAPAIGRCPLAAARTLRSAFPGGTGRTRAAGSCRGLHAAGHLVRRGASSAGFVAACSGNTRLGRFEAHRPRLGEEHRGRQDATILSDHVEILRVLEISRRPLRQILGDRLGRHDVLCRQEFKEEVYPAACTFRAREIRLRREKIALATFRSAGPGLQSPAQARNARTSRGNPASPAAVLTMLPLFQARGWEDRGSSRRRRTLSAPRLGRVRRGMHRRRPVPCLRVSPAPGERSLGSGTPHPCRIR